MNPNPIELSAEIENRYRQYLKTTFHFKDSKLRKSFSDALDSGHLKEGPFVEATPIFEKGQKAGALFSELLQETLDQGFLKAIDSERELYQHQEEALVKTFQGKNVILATGTGSGKTESFLYPILLHLYQQFISGELRPGVQALILYPMNALANDQRERLGHICERLKKNKSPFRFTFGQYIGETPEDESDSRRNAREHLDNKFEGELIFRREMRSNPPHILLTNYSMLEYLLIRPDDSPLFDQGQGRWWDFLVLDEAHQYRGAKGIEMAMLIRRLKQRIREGGRQMPFRCIATSATIGGGDKDKPEVAKFASELFGENFDVQDVILGATHPIQAKGKYCLAPEDYQIILTALHTKSNNSLQKIVKQFDIKLDPQMDVDCLTGYILSNDDRAIHLRHAITEKPTEFAILAGKLFPELTIAEGTDITALLIEILQLSRDARSKNKHTPLLSIRYHFFLRSLEGAFAVYLPEKKVYLERKKLDNAYIFELAVCKNCGQHYFVGKDIQGKFGEAIHDPGDEEFGATFLRPIENEDIQDEEDHNLFYLCLKCGAINKNRLNCGHENQILVRKEAPPKDEYRADQIAKCSVCEYSAAGRDPVREIVHGHDGPNAVIASTLYQHLPEDRKKILSFADSRQEAAFFAWYLETSYKDILHRNLIYQVARELGQSSIEGLSLKELADEIMNTYRRASIFPETLGQIELRKNGWLSLYRELLTDETRISLEGVGLVKWQIKFSDKFIVPEVLTNSPWSLSNSEAMNLIFILLNFMRLDRAIELKTEPGVNINWEDLNLQGTQFGVRIGNPGNQRNVKSWDSRNGRRGRFLTRLLLNMYPNLEKNVANQITEQTLREIWEHIRQFDQELPDNSKFLFASGDARRLNPAWWRLYPVEKDTRIFQCGTCGRLQSVNVKDTCTQYRCDGILEEKCWDDIEPNHYRMLYQDTLPGMLRSEEHTAQLSPDKARSFQKDFVNGKIHVLSSSTTFELGVDLGNLDTVFLRNVPPEAFNYAQRVGRAGRRIGHPGLALTYCRRNPHDVYHFLEPEKIIKGKIRPPVLIIKNPKILLRHISAVAFSYFFRKHRQHFYDLDGKSKIKQLFVDLENPNGVKDFKAFVQQNEQLLMKSLSDIIPASLHEEIGLNDSTWIEKIAGSDPSTHEDSIFLRAELEISSDYQNIKKLEEESANQRNAKGYDMAKWANRRAKTIEAEDVLSFLSRKAIIPKYGFPVDVVELDVHKIGDSETMDVILQRDLAIAISEFAPTNKVIANKKEWQSYGLKKVAEREWPYRKYVKCEKHNYFASWKREEEKKADHSCRLYELKYLIPQFGFISNKNDRPKEPNRKTERMFSTKPYFAGPIHTNLSSVHYGFLEFWRASPGTMIVLCEGKRGGGFYICQECGAGFLEIKANHNSPFGKPCRGKLENFSLGHEFITDVVKFQFLTEPNLSDINPVDLAYSLAYAILEGAAEILEVPSNDLNATVGYLNEAHKLPPIILYDNVPGGAGLVARLEDKEILFSCLETAKNKVYGQCGCDSSCYGCLRSYRNQFIHQRLDRKSAFEFLAKILTETGNGKNTNQ